MASANPLNRDSLVEYLNLRYSDRPILFDLHPQMLDELLAQLCIREYKTTNDLDRALARTANAVALYEKDHRPSDLQDSHFSGLGIVRLSMLLLDDDFFTSRTTLLDDLHLRENLKNYRQYIQPENRAS